MSWDSVWEEVFQGQEWGKYPAESLIQFIARNFYKRERKKTKLLEIGCGPGANIWYMAKEGFDVYGVDGSQTAIGRAKKRLNNEDLKAHLAVGDIIKLSFKDNYFEGVVDVECLCHNSRDNTGRILDEIKRVLKSGGLFYSRTFADTMYIGNSRKEMGYLEYSDISDGPLAGKGF